MNTYIEDNSDQTSSAASSHTVSYDPIEHIELGHVQPTPAEPPRFTTKSKEGLRKGKWTPEEELYTNKVIEVFNAGLLKLSDSERGITLRAYLADKLHCDPMRITKKYTGASCLGKRVFHFDYQHADHAEAERARQELQILENNFRMKLEVMSKKRICDARYNGDNAFSISTPAIDALLHRNRINNNTMMPMMFPLKDGTESSGPFGAFPTKVFFAAAAASYRHHQLQQYQQQQQQSCSEFPREETFVPPPGSGLIHFIPPASTNPSSIRAPMPFPAYFYPSMMMPSYFMNKMDDPIQVPIASAADLRLSLFPSMGCTPSWKDFSQSNIPMTSSADEHKAKKSRHNSIGDADYDAKVLCQAGGLFGSQENLLLNIASFDEDPLGSSKQIENEHNAAACSLLDYSNHMRRNTSQESFVEFFEAAQKNATYIPDHDTIPVSADA